MKKLVLAATAAVALTAGTAHADSPGFQQIGPVENRVGVLLSTMTTIGEGAGFLPQGTPAAHRHAESVRQLNGFVEKKDLSAAPRFPLAGGARVDMRQPTLAAATGLPGVVPYIVEQTVKLNVERETSIPLVADVERMSGGCSVSFGIDGRKVWSFDGEPNLQRAPRRAVAPPVAATKVTPGEVTASVTYMCWPRKAAADFATLGYVGEEGIVPFDTVKPADAPAPSFGWNRGEVSETKPTLTVAEGAMPWSPETMDKKFFDALGVPAKKDVSLLKTYDAGRQAVGEGGAKAIQATGKFQPTATGNWYVAIVQRGPRVEQGNPNWGMPAHAVLLTESHGRNVEWIVAAPNVEAPTTAVIGWWTANESEVAEGAPVTLFVHPRQIKAELKPKGDEQMFVMGPGETRFRPASLEFVPD